MNEAIGVTLPNFNLNQSVFYSHQYFLVSVSVVKDELFTSADGLLGDQDHPGHLLHHYDLGLAVGIDFAVVH